MTQPPALTSVQRVGTAADRARSLARSVLRLRQALDVAGLGSRRILRHLHEELAERARRTLPLADVLRGEDLHPNEEAAVAEILGQHEAALRETQEALLRHLGPRAPRLRRTLLQVAVSDEDLDRALREASGRPPAPTEEAPAPAPPDPAGERGQGAAQLYLPEELAEALPELVALLQQNPADPDLLESIAELAGPLELNAEDLLQSAEAAWRRDLEERPLSLRVRLRAALTRAPAHWLEASHERLLGPGARRRKAERVADIARHLESPAGLAQTLGLLGRPAHAALAQLLTAGGWSKAAPFCRRHGSDQTDGWFWAEDPPRSVLGQLRLHGLVVVGSALLEGRRQRVVVVPLELRPLLEEQLPALADSQP